MLKGVCVGAGYFSRFHYEAWSRIAAVKITALCDADEVKANKMATAFSISKVYTSLTQMLDTEHPDFVDIITPPETHLEFCREVFKRKINAIVQKPLAPSLKEAAQIVDEANAAGVRIMVHENFRFQPWYREIKNLINKGEIGKKIFSAYFRMRMGDGWGEDAYLNRQPYFREMSRLLVYETGIHFIDTFRYLFGDINEVYAKLRKLNPVIKGEDAGIIHFEFENGVQAVWDANRFNESNSNSPRYTFGEMLIEGSSGSIRLYNNSKITIQHLGTPEKVHVYAHADNNFAGDCVFEIQKHFVNCLISGEVFETNGIDYLKNIKVQDAVYLSSIENKPILVR